MPKSSVFTKTMALILLLSFLLLSTALLSFFVGERSEATYTASQAQNADETASLSFFVCNFVDFLEAKNFAFKLGLGTAFQSRKVFTERSSQLFGMLMLVSSAFLFSCFKLSKTYPPLNSFRITEFLHAKDGMI